MTTSLPTSRTLRIARTGSQGLALGLGLMSAAAHAQAGNRQDVVVVGEPDPSSSLPTITTPLLDTPQSISVVNGDEIERRGVNTLSDALRVVPGISLGAGETSWQGDNFYLRGFTTRNDMFLDGMRDYGYYNRDPFNDERVEVLQGPSAVLFGRGATGGAIEQVSKRPQLAPMVNAELSIGSDDTERATVDVGEPLGAHAAVRVNAMAHHSEVADRDGALDRRWGVAPSIAFGIGTPTQVTLSWLHQEERNRPDYGIPWFNGAPASVDRSNYYGFADDYLRTNVDIVTASVDHQASSALSLHGQVRYSNDRRSFRTSEAVIPAGTPADADLSSIQVSRNEFSGFSNDQLFQAQASATWRFTTGALHHTLVTGVEVGREQPAPTYIFHVGVIGTSLANPQPQSFQETSEYVRLTAATSADTVGLYALDSIDVGSHLQFLAGLRWDSFAANYRSTGYTPQGAVTATTAFDQASRRLSGRGAIVYKPDARSTLYLTYANSFDPSAAGIESLISSGRSVAQANLDARPETSRIWEAGAKQMLFGNRLMLSGAVFRTVKNNVRVPDPASSGFNTNGGTQRVQGVTLEATGKITPLLSVHLGYAFLDSTTLATDNPTAAGSPRIGEELPVTPRNSGSVQLDYQLLPSLSVGGGAIYQSSRLGQNTNSSLLRAPGYVVFDARARYRINRRFALQGNLLNLTDKLYYDQLHPFHVVPGAGRSILMSFIVQGL